LNSTVRELVLVKIHTVWIIFSRVSSRKIPVST